MFRDLGKAFVCKHSENRFSVLKSCLIVYENGNIWFFSGNSILRTLLYTLCMGLAFLFISGVAEFLFLYAHLV